MRTFYHDIGQTRDNIKSLGNGHLRFLSCESIESVEGRFYFGLSQKFLYIFLYYI